MAESQEKSRRWYPGHPWVGVGVIIIRDGRMLMVKRGKDPYKGMWSIPGGGLELGETLFEGAKREVFEESSVIVEIDSVLDTVDEIIRDEQGCVKYHFIDIDVRGSYVSGEARAQSDAAECRWVALKEIEPLDVPSNLRAMLKKHGII